MPSTTTIPIPARSPTKTSDNTWFWTDSPEMREIEAAVRIAARRNLPVLIVGETGSGKELIARRLHHERRDYSGAPAIEAPFVAVNVSTIPENLAESVLFGHERGAFTSARERQLGKFEIAKRGILFLDEIQNLDPSLQCKLLRVLQSREFDRIGARGPVAVDCQVVAATNLPLEMLVAQGRFRKDLYFRLNVFPIYLPPLRQRKNELPEILERFLREKIPQHGLVAKPLDDEALAAFLGHDWPGNFRELEHALVYAHLKSGARIIGIDELPPNLNGRTAAYLRQGSWN